MMVTTSGHKVQVWKQKKNEGAWPKWVPKNIWRGRCECGFKTQYWDFGAVFGAMIYHQWKALSKRELA